MSDSSIVRQPIFDSANVLKGFEIRFRDSAEGRDAFTQSIVTGTLDIVRSGKPAYISCTRAQLLDEAFQLLQPKSTVLLMPWDLTPDEELGPVLEAFRAAGGTIALDELDESPTPNEAFGPLATWARVDMRNEDFIVLARICDRAATGKRQLIADHVLDQAQYDQARQLFFDGYIGEFFSRPELLPAAQLPASTIAAIRLLGLARDVNTSDRKLEDAISVDPALTFQLLRLVNSASVGARGVKSIGQALSLIGRTAFMRFLAVTIAASRKSRNDVDAHLVRQAIERARFLEQMADSGRDAGTLFLVGLFSMLDVVFRMPLADILESVGLSDDANSALLDRIGAYAAPLEITESYELGMFENAESIAIAAGIDAAHLGEWYTGSIAWTTEALSAMAPAK